MAGDPQQILADRVGAVRDWLRTHGGAVDEHDEDAQRDMVEGFILPLLSDAWREGWSAGLHQHRSPEAPPNPYAQADRWNGTNPLGCCAHDRQHGGPGCKWPGEHDHGDTDGYIFTARDYWRGMYALKDSHWEDIRTLFDHGPYKDHCGGYEVHAWPCHPAGEILAELRGQMTPHEWASIDFFAQADASDPCPAGYERDCDWWPADGVTERCSMCHRDRPVADADARSRDAVEGMSTWPSQDPIVLATEKSHRLSQEGRVVDS